ncbi:MAG: transporter substrate-binding domain-containing protein [Candidatus Thiodiazotropha taylori]|nr:transporter substrate-binding domain-containing protein [Candidatus Thiodiazotropha taylori]
MPISETIKETFLLTLVLFFLIVLPVSAQTSVDLTAEEREWIKNNPVIQVSSQTDYPPFDFVEKGQAYGIAVELIRLYADKVGLDVEFETASTWDELMDQTYAKELDLIMSIVYTEERYEKGLRFSDPYFEISDVLVTRQNEKAFKTEDAIIEANKVFAMVKGYAETAARVEKYPAENLLLTDNIDEALKQISLGRADAFIGTRATVAYLVHQFALDNLKLSPFESNIETRYFLFATEKSNATLLSIINKAMQATPEEQEQEILNKWISVSYVQPYNWQLIIQISLGIFIVFLIVFWWNRKLSSLNEQLLEAKQAAEMANQAKSTFLANMSHELRTPLNAILGFTEILGRARDIPQHHLEKLAIINRSGEYLLSMINDILDLSKVEAGRMELEPTAFNLPVLLKDIGQMFTARAERAGLRFELDIAPDLTTYIKTDGNKLRQVLINLLGNSVKFTQEGGFSLRARTEAIADDPKMVTLKLEVEDSGPGMAKEDLEHIFDPFVQAGHSPSSVKGTGLGLAITRSILQLLGDDIRVESEPGKGTLFKIDFPVAIAQADEVEKATSRLSVLGLAPDQPQWRILVVEDILDNRVLLQSLLSDVGFEVKEAEDGEQAISVFQQWQPHLIWMDMRMPVMDGYEATRRIRELPGGKEVKIVALTTSAFKDQRKSIIAIGCDDILHKPFQSHEIFEAMAQVLDVQYIYDEAEAAEPRQTKVLTADALQSLPYDLKEALLGAAEELNISGSNQVIDRISAIDNEIAAGLSELVENFRFDQVVKLLRK